jgi:hypothetical protein
MFPEAGKGLVSAERCPVSVEPERLIEEARTRTRQPAVEAHQEGELCAQRVEVRVSHQPAVVYECFQLAEDLVLCRQGRRQAAVADRPAGGLGQMLGQGVARESVTGDLHGAAGVAFG